VDDGSTDRTPEIVKKFEPRVRLLRKKNGGQASAFNAGIPECKGEIVAFLDGDDWWAPNKLTRVSQAMAADTSVGIVGHGLSPFSATCANKWRLSARICFQANTMAGALLFRRRGAFFGTSRMTIRAELLRQIGAVPEAIEIQADEYLFTLSAVLAGAQILPEALTYYAFMTANAFSSQAMTRKNCAANKNRLRYCEHASQQLRSSGSTRECGALSWVYQSSADQIRLGLDGGWPWETAKTEWTIMRYCIRRRGFLNRVFKLMILLGALVTTPRLFTRCRETRGKPALPDARARWLPVPRWSKSKRWHAGS